MISVAEALEKVFALAKPPVEDTVPLAEAAGRVLLRPIAALRDQPPFASSAMDGYAIGPGSGTFAVVGEAPAGRAFEGRVGEGQAIRIFTGAPLPDGADRVAIQENARRSGDSVAIDPAPGPGENVRPAGGDFRVGDGIDAPRVLRPQDLALLAAMNVLEVTVASRPSAALIATGDELAMPGEDPRPDQIMSSNSFGLAALFDQIGAETRVLPIARDTEASLTAALRLAEGADLVVTIGGASVGDHDLVGPVAERLGMERSFYKIAMRPGKPLMAGRLGDAAMIGLPGNPVSAFVCGHLFAAPLIRAMLGLGHAPAPRRSAPLAVGVEENGPREHYMRARLTPEGLAPFDRQDSSLLSILGEADALLVRPVADPPRKAGEMAEYVPL